MQEAKHLPDISYSPNNSITLEIVTYTHFLRKHNKFTKLVPSPQSYPHEYLFFQMYLFNESYHGRRIYATASHLCNLGSNFSENLCFFAIHFKYFSGNSIASVCMNIKYPHELGYLGLQEKPIVRVLYILSPLEGLFVMYCIIELAIPAV